MMRAVAGFVALALAASGAGGALLDEWVEDSSDPSAAQEFLDEFRQRPLDLNGAKVDEIARLPFFDIGTARQLVKTRRDAGGFRRMGDALSETDLTPEQREVLRTLCTIERIHDHGSAWQSAGFSGHSSRSTFRATFESGSGQRGHVAVNSEPGEITLASVAVQFEEVRSQLVLTAGDFQLESGTGLVLGSGYGMSNWLGSPASSAPPEPAGLRLTSAKNRLSRLRGAAAETASGHFPILVFASVQRMDADIDVSGTARITEGEVSSPDADLARRDRLEERMLCGELGYSAGSSAIGFIGYSASYSPALQSDSPGSPDKYPAREAVSVGSFHGHLSMRGLRLAGEAARSIPGANAYQVVLSAAKEGLGFSAYSTDVNNDFFSPHGRTWGNWDAEAVGGRRTGVKFGTGRKDNWISLHAWAASQQSEMASFGSLRSSEGLDAKWEFRLVPTLSGNVLASHKSAEELGEGRVETRITNRWRLEVGNTRNVGLRMRLEVKTSDSGGRRRSTGTMVFLQVTRMLMQTSVFFRLSVFHADDYNTVVRAYENSPLGVFPLVSFYGSGRRVALMLSRDLGIFKAAAKLAHTLSTRSQSTGETEAALQLSKTW